MAFTLPCIFKERPDQLSQIKGDVMEKRECPEILYINQELKNVPEEQNMHEVVHKSGMVTIFF